jgi:hypothetical protein
MIFCEEYKLWMCSLLVQSQVHTFFSASCSQIPSIYDFFLSWQTKFYTELLWIVDEIMRVRKRVKRLFLKKEHIYYKYTKTKLILLFNVIPLDFNAQIPEFRKFYKFGQKRSFLVASLTNFALHQWLPHRMKIFFLLELISLGQTCGSHREWGLDTLEWNEPESHLSYPPKSVSINLLADGWLLNFLATGDVGRFQVILWALLSGS